MLISLNWIRDFVDLPNDLDPVALVERFTRTTAEVETVERVQVGAKGLIVARIEGVAPVPEARNLQLVTLDVGGPSKVQTVSAAPSLAAGDQIVYAPPGASVRKLGAIGKARVAGQDSAGMIPPAEALGISLAVQEAVFVNKTVEPGTAVSPDLFDDWVMEIDNKSITHRPDLWGHYGIAREIAALLSLPLKPYPGEALSALEDGKVPSFPLTIAAPQACRRYSGLLVTGVPTQPGPLWMQLRLGRVGMRPISALVDLTNYVMADLGQPMHAFDGDKVDRIEVDWAKDGEAFRTLDGVERRLDRNVLMIQSGGRSVAIAGVMGGHDTEVSPATRTLLLESANFDGASIRRASAKLGLRTEASARFEKSLDPAHTVRSIQRFMQLAGREYPNLKLVSRLCDCYPSPFPRVEVPVEVARVSRTVGCEVSAKRIRTILEPLGFEIGGDDRRLNTVVPSYRATGDVAIEADVIEEVARFVGYNAIAPSVPTVSVRRFEPNHLHELEQRTIGYFTGARGFHEIHGYVWYDEAWLGRVGVDPGPCIELKNPVAEGSRRLRRTLLPGLLGAVEKNRFHFSSLALLELGSAFEPWEDGGLESRRVGSVVARRGKKLDEPLHAELKGAIEGWAWDRLGRQVEFVRSEADAARPWEHGKRTAKVLVDGLCVGRTSVVDFAFRRALDEHLSSWSIAWAEVVLDRLATLAVEAERLGAIPAFPQIEMDFSLLVSRAVRYAEVVAMLRSFDHELLRTVRYVACYEGEAIGAGLRSLTFRVTIGSPARTLSEQDAAAFREAFENHVRRAGYEIRK